MTNKIINNMANKKEHSIEFRISDKRENPLFSGK